MRITCLDFETANFSSLSICSAGIAVFEDGQLAHSRQWLIKPPKGHGFFNPDFIEIHGLTWFKVSNAPEFPGVATELLPILGGSDVVLAHNVGFDINKLRTVLEHFGLEFPAFEYLCTLALGRRVWPSLPDHRLPTLAAHIGHGFQHHDAQADAEAAGRIFLAMMAATKACTPRELAERAGVEMRRFVADE